ncbi:uncharacterized protein LOC124651174 [Lolium rigidum]|uniref:uncharacterized protein LOC124651174 n=1 Tax=Lolium rigidum TaxID=89674 RepID=UPI001F5DE9D1|nr:uncharacterized protein LOC124651174 [Lolium rigidum]
MGRQSRKLAKRRADAEAEAAAAPPATSTSHSPPAKKQKLSSGLNNWEAEKLFGEITSKLKNYPRVSQPLPRRLKIGTRSLKDKDPSLLTWTCNKCRRINYPRRYLLTDLPVIQCECGEEADIEFDFSMANIEVNGECPIGNVKNQQKEPKCTVYSTASNIEATLRMRQILSGQKLEDNKPVINIDQLVDHYEFLRINYGINQKPEDQWNYKTIRSLFIALGLFGAVTEEPSVHELGDYVRVNKNFYDICRVLADGHPLTTGIVPGKKFRHLKPGQIYKAPKKEKFTANKKDTGHAILLIGAGRRRKTNYYHFLNSWGENFCLTDDGKGGFGMVRASDITLRPLKFIRYKEEVVHHQSLASTYKAQ